MGQIDALQMVDHIRSRLVDLATAENYIRDRSVMDACRNIWSYGEDDGGLVSELWVEGAFPGEKSEDTLERLNREGILPRGLYNHLRTRGAFPTDRKLYNHQSEILRQVLTDKSDNSTFVITAGTGLGKTEAFLLPMLSNLWNLKSNQPDDGMQCLILYPMNALVNDQVERLYNWLRGQSKLTLFHFTSETPEDARAAARMGIKPWDTCRMRTRQEARGLENHKGDRIQSAPFGPTPDIVITNYSMLEYMLCRPQDSCFFGPSLKCIILDEAHLYSGTLAAEIAMLLRRVKERCGVKEEEVLKIATSATLGGTDTELRQFASRLFDSKAQKTSVIRGNLAKLEFFEQESTPSEDVNVNSLKDWVDQEINTLTDDNSLLTNASKVISKS